MRLPAQLARGNTNVHKNHFGHVLILAGSSSMLGAAALCGLAAMRCGAGLTTLAVAKSLNLTLQKKISPVIMTMPLLETKRHGISLKAYSQIKEQYPKIQAMAVGPGLGKDVNVKKLILNIIKECPVPLVVDADALNILSEDMKVLLQAKGPRVLTPHLGEMHRLTGFSIAHIEKNRKETASTFAKKYSCVLLLKGHQTVIAAQDGRYAINQTGNAGMATAGSGDVLTGMIAAFLGQGIELFDAARLGCYWHGKSGDLAAQHQGKVSLIALDIIDHLHLVLNKNKGLK